MICSFHHWSQLQWSFILQISKFFRIKFILYFLVIVPVWKQVSGKKILSQMVVSGKKILTQNWWAEKNIVPNMVSGKKLLSQNWWAEKNSYLKIGERKKLHHFFPLTSFETIIFFRSPVLRQDFFSAHQFWVKIFFTLTTIWDKIFFSSPFFRQGLVLENIRKSWSWKI